MEKKKSEMTKEERFYEHNKHKNYILFEMKTKEVDKKGDVTYPTEFAMIDLDTGIDFANALVQYQTQFGFKLIGGNFPDAGKRTHDGSPLKAQVDKAKQLVAPYLALLAQTKPVEPVLTASEEKTEVTKKEVKERLKNGN